MRDLIAKCNTVAGWFRDPLFLVGRLLLSFLFFDSGFGRLTGGWADAAQQMQSHDVPLFLLPFVTALELFGGAFLALGLLSRLSTLGLGVFAIIAAFVFFGNFADTAHWFPFLDNIAIGGGMLLILGAGPGRWSLDHVLGLERSVYGRRTAGKPVRDGTAKPPVA
ncbi:DoxX family protein [Roseibium sp. RKSG952]|uniref:DoxX family protein n=1 Tax=Roseibium sp. RKSG952 TaxID=2529384 RepID=UPI0012BB6F5E|nr:DoxX family protein [Roseibium sp. RKSG952]MTH95654.1 DoxX family protein [Roseibium sp. RKSG952]